MNEYKYDYIIQFLHNVVGHKFPHTSLPHKNTMAFVAILTILTKLTLIVQQGASSIPNGISPIDALLKLKTWHKKNITSLPTMPEDKRCKSKISQLKAKLKRDTKKKPVG